MITQIPLDGAVDFVRGITFKPTDLVEPLSSDSIVCMRTKNIQHDLDQSDLIAVPPSFVRQDKKILREGDILLSSANSWELVGKCCFVPKLPYRATAGGFISIVRAKTEVDSRYLYHWLTSPSIQHKLRYCGRQTTNISNLDVNRFKELEFPKTGKDEQRRIAAILDKADAIRRKREQAIALADDFLRSFFLDMFGDLSANSKNWVTKRLGKHIVHSNNGISRRRKTTENTGDIVLRLQDVRKNEIKFDDCNRIALNQSERPRFELVNDDLLFVRVNGNCDYVGRCAVFTSYSEPVFHNDHIIRIRLDDQFDPFFLSFLFNLDVGRSILANSIKTSAGQYTISQNGLKDIEIPTPPAPLQKQFRLILEQTKLSKITMHMAFLEASDLFASLSQRAFQGEL